MITFLCKCFPSSEKCPVGAQPCSISPPPLPSQWRKLRCVSSSSELEAESKLCSYFSLFTLVHKSQLFEESKPNICCASPPRFTSRVYSWIERRQTATDVLHLFNIKSFSCEVLTVVESNVFLFISNTANVTELVVIFAPCANVTCSACNRHLEAEGSESESWFYLQQNLI